MVRRAAVALAALTLLAGCSEPEETGGTPAAETPVTLQLPAAGSGRCLSPTADALSRADVAFDGRVENISGSDVELKVDTWFASRRGRERDESVVVTTLRGTRSTEAIPIFRRGDRYLVAALGTQVMICGATDVWSPDLEVLYRQAFG
ncbi:hypothetical protein G7072_01580 [Nocardioides sp. HDW12B]|uniref:hypothetical protein n=1 Tax=Nocardioides sp. HDW12B TaxID=2714939 RepID=UPI001408C1FE|nr:hypothetical protein [Nocardioides sp. HDW12B]QIK65200.1 hypothetical protein G7072_01580 [Nocardioides sp. HDW12B]